ncbi:NAD(P)/FAD-dependent oxidoreductase [Flavobacterium sp. RHBU_24]|uniref:NAD(P)/FAD-dependent oxidoreductase n=1 Tax=Flavobacterium sp. RHBU_24 TaxID=3391185 RepID=UPI003984DB49
MAGNHIDTDVVIVGAGPSGSAAAIWCLRQGLSVVVLEKTPFPRDRPGETLHPGIEVVFRTLGVFDDIVKLTETRHEGINIRAGNKFLFVPYGSDQRGTWLGFQVKRSDLDNCLLSKAVELGAVLRQPAKSQNVICIDGKVSGVVTDNGIIKSKFIIDATGNSQWLRKQLGLTVNQCSQKLLARYGYTSEPVYGEDVPVLSFNENGWRWDAKISEKLFQWTQLEVDHKPFAKYEDKFKGADVTWRIVRECAGAGYFLTGEAAAILDPGGSKGVLRAIYSGVMAADSIAKIVLSGQNEKGLCLGYQNWMRDWFFRDCDELNKLYLENGHNVSYEKL